jgi:hypothetical protein
VVPTELDAVVAHRTDDRDNPRCDRLRVAQGGWQPLGARWRERSPAGLLGGEQEKENWAVEPWSSYSG